MNYENNLKGWNKYLHSSNDLSHYMKNTHRLSANPKSILARIRLLVLVSLFFSVGAMAGTNYYWFGGAGNWNDGTHWGTATNGGGTTGTAPTSSDVAIFDASSGLSSSITCTVSAAATVGSVQINGGSIRIATTTTNTLTTNGDFQVNNSAVFYYDNTVSGKLYVGGAFFVGSSASILPASSGTWTIYLQGGGGSGNNISSANNTGNTVTDYGKINFTVNAAYTLNGNVYLNTTNTGSTRTFTINASGASISTSTYTFDLQRTQLVLTNGALNVNTGGTLETECTLASPITYTAGTFNFSGTVIYNGAAAESVYNTTYYNLTLNQAQTFTALGAITVNGTLKTTLSGTIFDMSTYQLSGGGSFAVSNTGIIKTSYVGASAIPAVSYGTTGTVQYAVSGQTVVATTYNNLTLTSNTTAASGTITLNGNWSNSGTFTPGTNTVTFSGGGAQSITGATTFYNLSTATSNTNLTVGSAISVSTFFNVAASTTLQLGAALTLSTSGTGSTGSNIVGTLQLNSGGSVVTNSPYYTSTSTLIYNTGATANVGIEWTAGNTSGQAGVPNNVQIGNGVASSAFSFNGSSSTYTMTGNLNITSNTGATLTFGTSGTATLNIMGSFTNSGTFTPVSGTVNFNGSSASQTFSTGQTFYGLTMSNASATVPFPAATTTTYLTIAASITQPVSTTIATANLTINTGITFTQSPASTASQSTNTAGSNNAVFNMNSGANTISIGNSGVLNINGWFKSAIGSGTITIGTGAAINVNSNAVYNCSGSGSNLPAATWATTSTLYFSGIAGSAPTMPTTVNTYGNIIWNCTGQTTTSAYIFPSGNTATTLTINNLIVLNTGTAAYLKLSNTATSNVTINVANIQVGSGTGYSFNGSSITTAASGVATLELYYNNSTATSPTISVSGNILVAGSVTNSATATLTTGYGCTLATQGSFTVNNDAYSVFTNTGINSGSISVTFNGTTNQTITGATTFGTINIGSSSLPASSVSLASSSTLTYNALTVYGNATLTTANSSGLTASSSSSTLTVNSSGKLIIGSGTTVTNSTTSSNTSIAGTLQMNGGSITTTPTYTSAGTLTYGSTATVGNEWGTGSTLATGAAQNVTINSGIITTGSTALYALGNLTISGGTLTLGGNLQVNGNWSDAGTLSGNYTVTFGGSNSNVTITNSNSGNGNTETFYGLTISNTNGVTLGSNVTVTDILTLSSAKLTTTGYVLNVKVATAGTSATSAATSTAYVNGPLTLTFPASTSGTATYNFPLGISNTFGLVNPSTGSGGTTSVTVQAYSSGNTAGFDATLASVSSGYWSYSTTGYFTSAKVALTSASVASNSVVADSVGGTSFTSYGGSVSSSTVTSSSNVNGATQYFALGVLSTTYYWVGGNGTWDNSTTTNWATASGGTGSTGVPGSNDRVVFDANSGATPQVTVAANISVKSLTFTNSPVVTFLFSTTSSPTAPITVGSLGLTLTGSTVVMGTGTTNATTAMGMGLTVNGPLLLQSSTSPAANSKLELCHYQASGSPTVTSNIFNGLVSTDVNNVLSVNSSSIAPQIQFTYSPTTVNSGTGNFYFDQTVSGGFALYKLLSSGAKQTIKLGNSINCGRLSLSSSSLASSTNPALDLNGNTLTASSGTSTYTNGSIKADATGSSLVITTSIAFPLGASEFTPASIYSLTLNSATNDSLTLLQPLTITNLYLDSNTIINSTNNITIASGGTIYVQGGKLRASPVLPSNVNIVVTGNCTSGYELPSTSTGTLQVNGGFTYTLAGNTTFGTVTTASSSSVLNLSTYTLGGSPTINNTGTIQTTSTSATPIPAVTYNGTVNYTASGGQTVVGTTYANLTLSNASGTQTAGGNITVNGTLTTTVGGTLDMSASNYSLTIGGTYTSGGTLTPRSGTVYFNGSSQSIPALNYYSLNLTSATGTLFPSGTVGIAGVFTPSSISSASQGTINFNGSSQSIPSFNYYNLSLASATGTLFPSGTVGIAGAFTPASITSASQGIINFNGTTNQTVPAFNYNSLTLGGTYTSTNNLTLASSGNIGIAGNFAASATFGTGGYIATSSTVNLNGTGTQTISSGFTFNTLNIYNGSVVIPITLTASNITIGDGTNTINLTQPAVTLITVTSAFTVAANATFTVAAGIGSSISSGTNNAVLNFNSANGTITNNGAISINGWFTNGNQNSSTATTLTGGGIWTIGGQGVYNHNTINGTIPTMTSWVAGSTLYYTGTHGANTLASGTGQSFRKVIYNCPANTSSSNYFNPTAILDTFYVVNTGNSTPRTLQLDSTGATISIATLVVGSGSSSYYFNGGGTTSNPVVVSLGTNHAPTITVTGDVDVQGNSSTNNATLYSSSAGAVLNVAGNWNIGSNGIFTSTNIAVNLNGSGTSSAPQTVTTGGQSFSALTVSNSTYVKLASATTVTNNLTLTSGTLDVSTSNYGLTVGGNFANTAGTFTCNSGTITFNGTGTQIISGSNTFNNLTDVTGGATLQFTAGTTQTVNGTLTLTGGISGNLLVVKSTIPGTQATINPTASSVSYCAITDVLNSNSTAITTTHSTNGGDNTNITFQSVYWVGGSNGDWNTTTNWSTGSVPGAGDVVVFDGNNIDGASTAGTSVVISPAFTSQIIGGITVQNNNLSVSLGSTTNILTLSTSGILTINSGDTLDMGSNSIACATMTTSGTGTLNTQSVTGTPLPTGRAWSVNVNFNKTSGAQTVLTGIYNGGLTISNTSGVDTVSGTATVNSVLTLNAGSTLSLGSVSTNLIAGTLAGSTGSGTFLLANTSNATYKIPSGLTWGGTFKYGYNGNPRITPGNYNNLTVDNGTSGVTAHTINWGTTNETDTISIAGTFSVDSISSFVTNSTTVKFTGSSQSIVSLYPHPTKSASFYNLDISGATGFMFPTGTTSIANTFTPGTNVISATQGTINFNGTGGQTIPAFNYYNLSISGVQTSSNNITLASSSTIGIAGAFSYTATYTSGSLVSTGSTINFNGTSGSTIPAFAYNNLSISGAQSGANNITLASSGTISVAGVFNPSATFGTGGYIVTGSTVSFVGSSAQSIPSFTFNNLTIANSTSISSTTASAVTVNGNLSLTSGILNDGGNTITVNGSITGTGTHTSTGSGKLVITGGTGTHYIGASSGTINLGSVQINSSSYIVGLAGNANINGTLALTTGLFNIYSYNLILANAPTGYNSSSYIYHYSSGNGTLTINNVGTGATVFPVGISSTYVPITFTNTSSNTNITVGFITNITNKPTINPIDTIGVQWSIQASTACTANVTFQYPNSGSLVGSGFASSGVVVAGVYTSGYSETILGSTSTNGSSFTNSTTSAITLPTGAASLYVIGNQYSFSAGVPTSTISYLTGGNSQATLGFSAVSNGASITSYTITPYIGATAQTPITGITSSPYTVTGLTNGTTYRFTVSAINSVGTGTSSYSNYITPATPTFYDTLLTNMTAIQNLYLSLGTYNSNTYGYITTGMTDSVFNTLDYIDNTSNTINLDLVYYNHIKYVLQMAEAYTNNYTYINGGINKSCYNNPLVLTAIKKSLYWWVDHVKTYTVNNWHYATIDYTNALGQILVLMRGIGTNVDTTGWSIIEQHAISNLFANRSTAIGTYAGTHKLDGNTLPSAMTGANAINISSYWLNWGALVKSPTVVDTALQSVVATLDFTQSTPEGLKQDYSFMQHYAQLYNEQYGSVWANAVITIANYLKSSSRAMSQSQLDTAYNFIHNTYYAGARGMYKDFNGSGREIGVYRNNGIDSTTATLAILVDQNATHLANYAKDAANSQTFSPVYTDSIHNHYYTTDYTIHKRPNFNFSVRGVSTRTTRSESINDQNLLGTFATEGATCILIQGNEYDNIFPNWNWNYVPGITMSDSLDGSGHSVTQYNPNSGAYDTGITKFVGGVSDGKFGASTFSLNYNNVSGNKSWFFFDSAVVCLGANIKSSKSLNVNTSVNQANINGPIYYNNTAGGSFTTFTPPTDANPATVTGTNIYSVFHDSIGYFFPAGGNVSIKQDSAYGNWSATDTLSAARPDTSDIFLLSLSHGTAPSAASYQYIVAPGISYSTMQSYNPLNTISILANTKYVQAVKHNGLNMMQVIFDSATSITDPTSGITVKVNQPCALMLSNMNQNPLTVTVSDPTQLLSNLTVTMSYSSNASQFNVVNETLPSGYYVGSSVSFTVDSTTASATWVGTNSTSYNTASNWLANVAPTTGANITIASGAPHYPVLNSSVATIINNMIISGGSFTVNSTDTLKVDSTIINTGGTVTVNGLVAYTGSSAQTIAANTFASNTVNNLRINNAAGVTLGGALNISGTLYPTSGTLTSAGYLTLLSSSAGTARVDNVYGSISGNVNVQRYISAKTARKFSFIGSPVAASIRSAWQQQIYITGAGTGGNACGSTTGDGVLSTDMYNSNGFDITPSGAASMFTYNATKINGSRYVSIPNTDQTNLVPGTGYILNIRGNRADGNCVNQLETGPPTAPDAVTLNATGTLTTGNLSATLYDTTLSKYTLLANPYPSQLSFSAFQTSNSAKVYNKMWTYSPFGSGNYTTYLNGIIANGATSYDNTTGNYIASGQAFFVEATQAGSAGTVTFNESHKTNGAIPNTQYFGATENKLIRISLQAASDSSLLDEVVVRFNSEGSAVYNPYADAHSFSAANQTLVSLKGTNRLAIATHPDIVDTDTTQLGISSKSTSAFRLLFSDYQALDNAKTITLIDNFLGTTKDVRSTNGYNFNITSDTASVGNNRFKIIVGGASSLPLNFTSIVATKNNTGVAVNWSVANQLNIANYEVERSTDGSTFATIATTKATNASSYSTEDKSIPADANTLYYRIKSIGENGNFEYSNVALLKLSNINYQLSIYPNPVQNKLNISLGTLTNGTYKVRIITVAGVEAFSKTGIAANGNTITIDASNLASGVYMLELTDQLGNKQLEKFVKH